MPIPSLCPLQSSQSVIPPIRMSSEMWGCFVITGMRDHKDILIELTNLAMSGQIHRRRNCANFRNPTGH